MLFDEGFAKNGSEGEMLPVVVFPKGSNFPIEVTYRLAWEEEPRKRYHLTREDATMTAASLMVGGTEETLLLHDLRDGIELEGAETIKQAAAMMLMARILGSL